MTPSALFSLEGKVAVVTGGSGTLGSSMCMALAAAGAKVGILGRRADALATVVAAVEAAGGEALALQADVLDKAQLEAARDAIVAKWGGVHILINGAGCVVARFFSAAAARARERRSPRSPPPRLLLARSGNQRGATVMPDESFFGVPSDAMEKVVKLNLNGTILPTQVFAEPMSVARAGTVINISSMAAITPLTRVCGYSASKAAIENLTRWLAVEFAQKYGDGLRVNAIAPGFFLAEQNRALLTKEDGSLTDRGQQIITATPMGRFGSAEELHGALIFLASDASKFVTGTSMFVDGGFAAFSGV